MRLFTFPLLSCFILFQSTHLQEVRRWLCLDLCYFVAIVSIHAPTRGATKYRSDIFASNRFQSTHLQEVRLGVILTNSHKIGFNPRTYKWCDTYFTITVQGFFKFQSTHLQEVRHYIDSWFDSVCYVSIHAPTRGATWFNTWMLFFCGVSIHAPTRGATFM